MSAAERIAWITEALKIAHWFRQNATARHGVPECEPLTTLQPVPTEPEQPPPTVNIINTLPATPAADGPLTSPLSAGAADTSKSLVRTAAPFLLSAALGAAAPGGLLLYNYWTTLASQSDQATKDGSLLQHLEDQGLHLPEGKQWENQ